MAVILEVNPCLNFAKFHRNIVEQITSDKIWLAQLDHGLVQVDFFTTIDEAVNHLLRVSRQKNGSGYNLDEEIILGSNHPLCYLCCEFSVRPEAPIIEFSHCCDRYFVYDVDLANKIVDLANTKICSNKDMILTK